MNVFICGAVQDILSEFSAKLAACGATVIGTQEVCKTDFTIPKDTEAVVIGIDQNGHGSWGKVVSVCKARGLPYATGHLRKWSHIYPHLLQVGIIKEQPDMATASQAAAAKTAPTPAVQVKTNEKEMEADIGATLLQLAEELKGKVKVGVIHFNDGRIRGEFEYMAKLTIDL